MENNPADHDEVVSQFCAMTGIQASEAQDYLTANGWDIEAAVTEFFAEQDEALQDANTGGGQSVGAAAGQAVGDSSASSASDRLRQSSSTARNRPSKKFATLGDFASGDGHSDDEDDKHDHQDFFAGGEKSGLAVQKPDDLKKKIIEKASKSEVPPSAEPQPQRSNFTGAARTLGGDDAPSQVIEPDNVPAAAQLPRRVQRTLHFWSDGFSVDDGDLYRSDDPRNAEILDGIRQGRAPLSIMNVQHGQEVDVEIVQHKEQFVKPKPKYKPFAGQGFRLGSPTPGLSSDTASSAPAPSQATAAPATDEPAKPDVDESQPVITLQVRLGDGTRLTSRFNTTHTVDDVYQFVAVASPISQTRPWVLMTTFPNKELSDKAVALGDLAEFKRGGVVVQKWQ